MDKSNRYKKKSKESSSVPYREKLSSYTSLTDAGCDKLESYASILHMPNFLRMYENLSSANGLVKMSANWWLVLINLSFTSWFVVKFPITPCILMITKSLPLCMMSYQSQKARSYIYFSVIHEERSTAALVTVDCS